MRDHIQAAWATALVFCAAAGSMIAAGLHGPSILDPAMVPLRYADQLVSGNGLVFNPGERVEGFGDPLWMALLSLGRALGADGIELASSLGIAGLGLTVLLVGWIGIRMLGERQGVLAALMIGAWPPMWVAARSLDDVMLLSPLILWSTGLLLSERDGSSRSCWPTAGLVLTALTGLVGAASAWVLSLLAQRKRWVAVPATLLMLSSIRWAYFGTPLPAHTRAMPWGGIGRWEIGASWLLQLLQEAPALAGLGMVGLAWALVRGRGWRGPAVVAGMCALMAVGSGPAKVLLWQPIVPVMGLLALLGVGLLAAPRLPRGLGRVGVLLVALGFGAQDLRVSQLRSTLVSTARQQRFVQARSLARFLALRFPDGQAIAAHKIGVVGRFLPNPIIDLSGRADAEISRAPRLDGGTTDAPVRSDIPGAIARAPAAFIHPRSMVGKRRGRIRVPPWYPDDFLEHYSTVGLSSRKHWGLTEGEQIWVFFFLKSGLKPVPERMKTP